MKAYRSGRLVGGATGAAVADITYIRLPLGFVYLAAIQDVFSRKVVGWALSRSLEATLVIEALTMALRTRKPPPGLIHHSDRGVQYALVRVMDDAG